MDILVGVLPGRLLNICSDCCDKTLGGSGAVVVVVVGVTFPPTINFAPPSVSSLADESSRKDRSRLS